MVMNGYLAVAINRKMASMPCYVIQKSMLIEFLQHYMRLNETKRK